MCEYGVSVCTYGCMRAYCVRACVPRMRVCKRTLLRARMRACWERSGTALGANAARSTVDPIGESSRAAVYHLKAIE